ncbi:MAG: ABC transporter permease, partial [Acidobacteriaceae bacterium]|nr:ABC transporter permease [Acidobacteriaceae bacterium]
MNSVLSDIRYALRGFRKDPGFVVLAMAALGLGIGAVTTIFSVIQNVLLDPFAYAAADRLMAIDIHDLDSDRGGRGSFGPAEFLDYKNRNHVFEAVAGATHQDVLYRTGEGTQQFDGAEITPGTFEMLGMDALLGRGLTRDDAKPDAPPVFVMSYKMWAKSFQLDPNILSRTFVLNNEARTLVGIMPPRFTFMGADLWISRTPDPASPQAKTRFYWFLGRLKPGITKEKAAADLQVLAKQLAPVYKDLYPKRFSVRVVPLAEMVVGGFRATLLILMGAVGMLLLIACGNVANMLLARATAREKEIAVRVSMGATRWRLIQQFLTESMLLAVAEALLGCGIAWAGIRILIPNLPPNTIPDEAVIRLNPQVLLFTLAV